LVSPGRDQATMKNHVEGAAALPEEKLRFLGCPAAARSGRRRGRRFGGAASEATCPDASTAREGNAEGVVLLELRG
jgi:hypothetical protein